MIGDFSALDLLHALTGLMTVLAAVLATIRIAKGPGLLDRTVAFDVLPAAGIGMIAVMIVWWHRYDLSVLLIILALTAFMSGVVVSSFATRIDRGQQRILSEEEAQEQVAERERQAEEAQREETEDAQRSVQDAQRSVQDARQTGAVDAAHDLELVHDPEHGTQEEH